MTIFLSGWIRWSVWPLTARFLAHGWTLSPYGPCTVWTMHGHKLMCKWIGPMNDRTCYASSDSVTVFMNRSELTINLGQSLTFCYDTTLWTSIITQQLYHLQQSLMSDVDKKVWYLSLGTTRCARAQSTQKGWAPCFSYIWWACLAWHWNPWLDTETLHCAVTNACIG